jgi:hypothetical protein
VGAEHGVVEDRLSEARFGRPQTWVTLADWERNEFCVNE